MGHAGRADESSGGLLRGGRNRAGRRDSNGCLRTVAARLSDAARHCDFAELCGEAILVRALLCVVAGGRNRRTSGRPHEKHTGGGADSREDGLGRTCEDAFWICRDAGRAAVDFFVLEQQSGREESRSGGRIDRAVRGDDRGIQCDAAEARDGTQTPAARLRIADGEGTHRDSVWKFAATRRRRGLRRSADSGASFGEARFLCLQRRVRRGGGGREGGGGGGGGGERRRGGKRFFRSCTKKMVGCGKGVGRKSGGGRLLDVRGGGALW